MIVAVRALSIDLFCSSMSERLEEFSSLVVHNRPPSVTVVAIIVPRSLKMSTDPQEREPANYRSAVRTSAAQRLSDPRHFQPLPVCESRGKSGMRGIIRDYPVRDRESLEETSKMNHGVDFSESGCTEIVEAMDRSDCIRICSLCQSPAPPKPKLRPCAPPALGSSQRDSVAEKELAGAYSIAWIPDSVKALRIISLSIVLDDSRVSV
jgi:hypothetical protein